MKKDTDTVEVSLRGAARVVANSILSLAVAFSVNGAARASIPVEPGTSSGGKSCEAYGYDGINFKPGMYKSDDCDMPKQMCYVEIPAVGTCTDVPASR